MDVPSSVLTAAKSWKQFKGPSVGDWLEEADAYGEVLFVNKKEGMVNTRCHAGEPQTHFIK